ncbi:membrane protein [Candidatus Magnetomorum sp. HK-1]|nr:membrane protein [Candidatus Magnetomorum sp. HK-1]
MDDIIKNIGTILATASTIAYITGYLVLRSRAHVLGTDPVFTLVDEAYVFSGVRFLFITLIVLLISSPIIFGIRWGVLSLLNYIPTKLNNTIQWGVLLIVGIASLMTFKIFSVNSILLQQNLNTPGSLIKEAIMGEQPIISLLLTFSLVILATLCVLWLKERLVSKDLFVWVLCTVVFIQIFMLPIYHGGLFADRKVRVLAACPESIKGLMSPVGIIDHTSAHYTLLGCDSSSNRQIATIKQEDINGIPIKKIVSLNKFIKDDLPSGDRAKKKGTYDYMKTNEKQKLSVSQEKSAEPDDSSCKGFFKTLVEYLHVTFEAIGSLGDSVVDKGQLWQVEIDSSGTPSKPRQIDAFRNLSWPVAGTDNSTFYALQQGQIIRIGKDSKIEIINCKYRWVKLLGVAKDGSILGFIHDETEIRSAIMSKSGNVQVSSLPLSNEEQKWTSRLLQENRSYAGGRNLIIERSERGGRGFDIIMESNGKFFNVSDCGDDRCGQASLSPDFKLLLFIKQPRN